MSIDARKASPATELPEGGEQITTLPEAVPPTETILLVEDEEMVRRLARHILEVSGYNVLEAASGGEAMELCQGYAGTVHLLLTDVVMPRMSGPQLRKEVTKLWPEIEVLYMSGYTDEVVGRYDARTDASFLQKPFSPSALAVKVLEILDAARKRRINT